MQQNMANCMHRTERKSQVYQEMREPLLQSLMLNVNRTDK